MFGECCARAGPCGGRDVIGAGEALHRRRLDGRDTDDEPSDVGERRRARPAALDTGSYGRLDGERPPAAEGPTGDETAP